MHVLFVTGEYPPMQGGVGAYTRELARALHAQGARVSVLTAQHAAQPCCTEYDGCIRVLPAIERWDWHVFRTVPALARELDVNWVHVQYQTAAFAMHPAINFAPWQWRRRGLRTAWTYHDLLPMYLFPKAGRRLRTWVTERPSRSADLLIVTNAADRAQLASHRINAINIPIGSNIEGRTLSTAERRDRRRQRGYADDDFVIAYFGFLTQSKGGVTLVETVRRLATAYPGVHLLMIGEKVGASDPTNYAYLQKVERLIESYQLTDRVQWTGRESESDVAADLNACDVLVLPFTDGASLRRGTLMAGLANGCAIVTTTPQHALPELEHGHDLLYVAPEDPVEAASAIRQLMSAPALRVQLQTQARRRSQMFRWAEIAQRHIEQYSR